MRLQDYRDTSDTFSGKASDASRQLAFAAIGLIWLFKKDVPASVLILLPTSLMWSAICVVLALAFDLLQYLVGYVIWWRYYRELEKKNFPEDKDNSHSVFLVIPIEVLFWLKILAVLVAYLVLGIYLFRVLIST